MNVCFLINNCLLLALDYCHNGVMRVITRWWNVALWSWNCSQKMWHQVTTKWDGERSRNKILVSTPCMILRMILVFTLHMETCMFISPHEFLFPGTELPFEEVTFDGWQHSTYNVWEEKGMGWHQQKSRLMKQIRQQCHLGEGTSISPDYSRLMMPKENILIMNFIMMDGGMSSR